MGWFKDMLAPAEPIECPRGWGSVSFVLKFFVLPPIFSIDRTCPIGGVDHCSKCRYPVEPGSAELLRQRLEDLDGLRGTTLSDEEFRMRRRLLIDSREPSLGIPGQDSATAALVLGPLGVVVTGAGLYVTIAVHAGFLSILMVGVVLVALAASFAGISIVRRRRLPNPEDLRLPEFRDDTSELEAELGRAREELGFFRELHGPESLGQQEPADADDS